jgi:phospholipid/cholesterol/gamma-HCH transport system ATP-binding protein
MSIVVQDLLLQVENLHKRFDDHVVLAESASSGAEAFSRFLSSGAGKSVFLKCLADVLQPDAGRIIFEGRPLSSGDRAGRAKFRQRCSFLFQNNALFDSLSTLENVALPLEQTTNLTDQEIRARSREALRQLEIDDHADRYPSQLSGGMQKRLALARAIVTRPELVFFDEPTAGLDPLRRNSVFTMIAKYQRQFNFTALIVTHDVDEALVASDRVALLDQGRICFAGTPAEFSASPNPIVRAFRDSAEALESSLSAIRRADDFPSEDS